MNLFKFLLEISFSKTYVSCCKFAPQAIGHANRAAGQGHGERRCGKLSLAAHGQRISHAQCQHTSHPHNLRKQICECSVTETQKPTEIAANEVISSRFFRCQSRSERPRVGPQTVARWPGPRGGNFGARGASRCFLTAVLKAWALHVLCKKHVVLIWCFMKPLRSAAASGDE